MLKVLFLDLKNNIYLFIVNLPFWCKNCIYLMCLFFALEIPFRVKHEIRKHVQIFLSTEMRAFFSLLF